VLAFACGRLNGDPVDAATPATCEAQFEASGAGIKTCVTTTDCTLKTHPSCCGNVIIGVSASALPQVVASESTYEVCMGGACGGIACAPMPDMAEDGKVPGVGQSIVAICSFNTCTSTVQ
jgi:hypothetical protein